METSSSDNTFLIVAAIVVFGLVLAFGLYSYRLQYRRADELLRKWAASSGYQVVQREDANPPGTGPKNRYAGNKQVMYRVTLVDGAGQQKRALIRLGDKVTGTLSDEVSVEWEP